MHNIMRLFGNYTQVLHLFLGVKNQNINIFEFFFFYRLIKKKNWTQKFGF